MRPSSSTPPPPIRRGPDHGVELSMGQVTLTVDGAGAVPSDTASTEMLPGTFRWKSRAFAPVYWPSQRSDPDGFGTLIDPPTCCLDTSLPVFASKLTWVYVELPTHASTSLVRPYAAKVFVLPES